MTELIPFKLLEEALSPVPRDFENIDIIKTYEKEVDGKIHVGFIAYVNMPDDDNYSVFADEGCCIFTDGNDYQYSCISEKEERIPIDDPRLPKHIRDKWIALKKREFEAFDLEDLEDIISEDQDKICLELKEFLYSRLETLRK